MNRDEVNKIFHLYCLIKSESGPKRKRCEIRYKAQVEWIVFNARFQHYDIFKTSLQLNNHTRTIAPVK